MKLKRIEIERFRHIVNVNFDVGKNITVIAGGNGTGKTSILGLLGHVYRYSAKNKTLSGKRFETKFSEVFKFSPDKDYSNPHKYKAVFEDGSEKIGESRLVTQGRKSRFRLDIGGRVKGGGKAKLPVIYLSLKRLTPIADEKWLTMGHHDQLSAGQKNKYNELYKMIFSTTDNVIPLHTRTSNKESYAPVTSAYDSYGISAGQDNIGQILLALIEFRKLKELDPTGYKGGLLLIDELDATLYPASQKNLYTVIGKEAKELDLQVIFTTHSSDILNFINSVNGSSLKNVTNFVGLFNLTGSISVKQGWGALKNVLADLNHEALLAIRPKQINVYFEDEEGCVFFRNIVSNLRLECEFSFKDISLGCGIYKTLIEKGFEEFFRSIVVLDGDFKNQLSEGNSKNVVFLPGLIRPENVIKDFLYNLPETDWFWENESQYTKKVFLQSVLNIKDNREEMKKWFNSQKKYWGKNCEQLFDRWKSDNLLEYIKIRSDTKKIANRITYEYYKLL